MTHYLIELALWILVAYAAGCVIGYLLRRLLSSGNALEPKASEPAEPQVPVAAVAAAPAVALEPAAAPAAVMSPRMERPRGLSEARDGKPDKLQMISGIGPKNEKILHSLGFFHFDQIAEWSGEHVAWVDDHLRFNGRISRERWIEQATLLASGNTEEFQRQYGTGGMKNESGSSVPGTKTRRS